MSKTNEEILREIRHDYFRGGRIEDKVDWLERRMNQLIDLLIAEQITPEKHDA